ncbi:MAG: glycosyltransferase family 4 protein [Gammaproteobacteria bacterium]|nr:glycosyltransferase family 4 protein [Gammaproteobacteria bacterium]
MTRSVAVILKGYPRLSETFIAEEIHALERSGVAVTLFSLRLPTERQIHPVHEAISAPVVYLPEYLYRQPLRVLRAWWKARRRPHYRRARQVWRCDLRRDLNANRIRRFGQAMVLAAELPAGVDLLYAHFLHTPASVARYAAALLDLPWSCSAHAKDIWTIPDWEKREKLGDCRWLTTCTRANFDHLRALAADPAKVALNYHGLDVSRFAAAATAYSNRDGADAANPVQILSVGRAVAKKGYDGLLAALADLPPDLHWEFTHIGGGPLLADLKRQAAELGIGERVTWRGAQAQSAVLACCQCADFFALNCRITADGDRDGLPNVLVEAQGCGLAVVATELSGIPELIEHGGNGLLVAPDDHRALTAALHRLITGPPLRRRLGQAGQKAVAAKFDRARNFTQLHRIIAGNEPGS